MPLNENIDVIVLNTNWANNENYWALFVMAGMPLQSS